MPGGAPTNLTALAASRLLATVHAAGPVEAARKQLGRDLLAEIRDADQRLKTPTSKITAIVAEHGSQLPTVDGIGPVIAGRLLGRTRRAPRERSPIQVGASVGSSSRRLRPDDVVDRPWTAHRRVGR